MLTLRKGRLSLREIKKKKNVFTCILRHFRECLHPYEAEREESPKKNGNEKLRKNGRDCRTRAGVSPDHPKRVEAMRTRRLGHATKAAPLPWSVPPASVPRHHTASLLLSLRWFHVRDPAPPIMCRFFLTVWWLLSLLCCHGNLPETVGAHYIYSLSSLFESELDVFCLGCHEKCPDSRVLKFIHTECLI